MNHFVPLEFPKPGLMIKRLFDLVNLPGYCFISNHRSGKTGGGVGLYLQDYLQYKLLQDCTISNPDVIESLFVEISNPHGKNIIVGTVYWPPNQNLFYV